MPAKKSKSRKPVPQFAPFEFSMIIAPNSDGPGFTIQYESFDDRAHAVCLPIVELIANSQDMTTTEIWTGETIV
jgi:hypothetical protein